MYSYVFICIFIPFAVAAIIDGEKKWKNETAASILGNSPSSSNSCGGVLHASSGVISYKQFDTLEPNEVCVWIVRAPGATGYSGNVIKSDDFSTITISSFGVSSATSHTVTASSYNVNGTVLVITISSPNAANNRGFYATFSGGSVDGHVPANNSSEDHLVPANSGQIKYPTNRSLYSPYESSIFVFEPLRNKFGELQKTQVLYIRNGLQHLCCDYLDIFTFNRNRPAGDKWEYLGRILDDVDSETITNHDLILIHFRTGASGEYSGFHLYAQIMS